MSKVKGILVHKKGPIGTLMTSDGQFMRVLLTGKGNILGQETPGLKFPSLIQGMAVASLLIVMLIGIWSKLFISPAAAYVALDINPSVELAVNESGNVIKAKGLNEDGKELLEKVSIKDREIYQAVEVLVEEAVKCNYLNTNNNVVLATVIPFSKNHTVVDQVKLETTVQVSVAELPAPIKVVIEKATEQQHRLAEEKGLSVGRFLIYQGSTQKGNGISVEELKTKGLGELEKEKGIEIQQYLPHPRTKAKVEFEVKESPEPQVFQDKENPTLEEKPNKSLPPGQLKKDKSPANWRVIPSHPANKGINSQDDDGDNDDDEKDVDQIKEDDGDKRRDDRRQSHIDSNIDQEKMQKPQLNKQQSQGQQTEAKDKDKDKGQTKGNSKTKE
ncbi:hypothetical protein JCM14036_16140 [Desulfotomaculum defluvii]